MVQAPGPGRRSPGLSELAAVLFKVRDLAAVYSGKKMVPLVMSFVPVLPEERLSRRRPMEVCAPGSPERSKV